MRKLQLVVACDITITHQQQYRTCTAIAAHKMHVNPGELFENISEANIQ